MISLYQTIKKVIITKAILQGYLVKVLKPSKVPKSPVKHLKRSQPVKKKYM